MSSCTVWSAVTKTYLYDFDPLKPHFYIVKLGFTWVYVVFLISAQNIDCEYSLEPPRRGGSNKYTQFMFWAQIWKISEFIIWKFSVFVVKFSIYLKRRVFVMATIGFVYILFDIKFCKKYEKKTAWNKAFFLRKVRTNFKLSSAKCFNEHAKR